MGSQPASLKNYRDEFDPLFPNRRKGWHKRPTRDYCRKVFEKYKRYTWANRSAVAFPFSMAAVMR